jgi:hypothetical protein
MTDCAALKVRTPLVADRGYKLDKFAYDAFRYMYIKTILQLLLLLHAFPA